MRNSYIRYIHLSTLNFYSTHKKCESLTLTLRKPSQKKKSYRNLFVCLLHVSVCLIVLVLADQDPSDLKLMQSVLILFAF